MANKKIAGKDILAQGINDMKDFHGNPINSDLMYIITDYKLSDGSEMVKIRNEDDFKLDTAELSLTVYVDKGFKFLITLLNASKNPEETIQGMIRLLIQREAYDLAANLRDEWHNYQHSSKKNR